MISRKPQWQVSGILEAPVEQVWDALLNGNPYLSATDKGAIAHQGTPFTTSIGKPMEGRIKIEIDKHQRSVTTEGEWWYRGVHTVELDQKGSRLIYSVYNIAPSATRWMAQLVQGPRNARTMPQQLQALLTAIGNKLHCAAYLTSE